MHRQQRPLPLVGLRVVDDQVDVTIFGNHAVVYVGVEPAHLLHVAGVYPESEGGTEIVVERRLAGLLLPGACAVGSLHGQGVAVGQVANHGVVPQFVGCFKDGGDYGVDYAEQ